MLNKANSHVNKNDANKTNPGANNINSAAEKKS